MKNPEILPPIVKDLIDALRKDDTPIHVRDNICGRLENIVDCANDAIAAFRAKQTRHYTIKSKTKA
jgi:hypothetical protein